MYRRYPNKKGKTFKYKGYTSRLFKRLYKSERFAKRNERKSIANNLVYQMKYVTDDYELEILEAKMLSLESPKTFIGYLD